MVVSAKILFWANVGYIVAVALGALTLFYLTTLVNSTKDRELKRFQIDAEATIEQSRQDAAEANARAEEAQLELARIKEPRTIAPSDQETLVNRLSSFSGQRYDLTVFADNESENLLWSIYRSLNRAGWIYTNAYTNALEPGMFVSISNDLKVRVATDSGLKASMQLGLRLDSPTAEALASLKIGFEEAGLDFAAGFRHEPIPGVTDDIIVIVVGEKTLDRNPQR